MLSLSIFVGRFFIVLSFEMLLLQTIFSFCIFVGRFFIIGSFEMLNLQTIFKIFPFLSVGSPLFRASKCLTYRQFSGFSHFCR